MLVSRRGGRGNDPSWRPEASVLPSDGLKSSAFQRFFARGKALDLE